MRRLLIIALLASGSFVTSACTAKQEVRFNVEMPPPPVDLTKPRPKLKPVAG